MSGEYVSRVEFASFVQALARALEDSSAEAAVECHIEAERLFRQIAAMAEPPAPPSEREGTR